MPLDTNDAAFDLTGFARKKITTYSGPHNKDDALDLAQDAVVRALINNTKSEFWVEEFSRRHEELELAAIIGADLPRFQKPLMDVLDRIEHEITGQT